MSLSALVPISLAMIPESVVFLQVLEGHKTIHDQGFSLCSLLLLCYIFQGGFNLLLSYMKSLKALWTQVVTLSRVSSSVASVIYSSPFLYIPPMFLLLFVQP